VSKLTASDAKNNATEPISSMRLSVERDPLPCRSRRSASPENAPLQSDRAAAPPIGACRMTFLHTLSQLVARQAAEVNNVRKGIYLRM
jgi:hypothetical protein